MPVTLSVGSFIRFGWESFKKRPWFLIGAVLLFFIAQVCVSIIVGIIDGIGNSLQAQILSGPVSFVVNITGQTLVGMGFIAFFLKAHDTIDTVQLYDAWHPRYFWRYLGTWILLAIILVIGFILLIIPGLIAWATFSLAPYAVIDKGLGPIGALKESARITKGNRWRLFALMTATMLLAMLGVIALFVGIFVAMPVTLLAMVAAYRRFSAAADAHQDRVPLHSGEKVLAGLFLLIPAIAIASSVLLASISLAQQKGVAARTAADLRTLQLGLELYYDANNNKYPATLSLVSSQMSETDASLYDQFTYTPEQDNKSYQLCANNPMPEGESQCVSSE